MRGDASDGLPGVAGVGEKTAATLLAAHGDLAGIRTAAAAGTGMSAGVARKIVAASDYLDVAPTVVRVATGLPISAPEEPLRPLGTAEKASAIAVAERWNLGTSMGRALTALDATGA